MSIEKNTDHFIWVESYRPTKIQDCILPKETKSVAESFVKQGRIPNLLFTGGAGTGKTTLAKAMCDEVGAEWIIINGSSERGIDTLRTTVANFASSVSFTGAKKVIIIDEADNLTQDFQSGFRNMMEAFAQNCTFILTCNFRHKILEPIQSRCSVIDFKIPKEEGSTIAGALLKRLSAILDNEGVEYEKKVLAELVMMHFPDFRRILNELQRYASSGKIDSGILVSVNVDSFKDLVEAIKNKKFNDARKWAANNSDIDTAKLFRTFYDVAHSKMEIKSVPSLILIISEYMDKSYRAVDQELNMMAFFVSLMQENLEWK